MWNSKFIMVAMKQKLIEAYKANNIIPRLIAISDDIPQSIEDYYVKLKILLSQGGSIQYSSGEVIIDNKEDIELKDIFGKDDKKESQSDEKNDKNDKNNEEDKKNAQDEEDFVQRMTWGRRKDDKSEMSGQRILVLGTAGVGKSTLMQYISYEWANERLWHKKFDHVYKVTFKQLLRDNCKDFVKSPAYKGKELEAFIAYNLANGDEDYAEELYDEIILDAKSLVLVDGYDEVRHMDEGGVYGKIKKAITTAQKYSTIMTSRPNAVERSLKSQFHSSIENVGLDFDGIRQYIEKYFINKDAEQQKILETFLQKNPNISEICKIPVNIAMLCDIWASSGDIDELTSIDNIGSLYEQMMQTLGRRFLSKSKKYSNGYSMTVNW